MKKSIPVFQYSTKASNMRDVARGHLNANVIVLR